jgi:hypothetical protein
VKRGADAEARGEIGEDREVACGASPHGGTAWRIAIRHASFGRAADVVPLERHRDAGSTMSAWRAIGVQ